MRLNLKILCLALALLLLATVPVSADFADVKGTSCETAVKTLSALGLLQGKSADAFEPDAPLTRAEMAVVTARLLGLDTLTAEGSFFEDVAPTHFAYHAIGVLFRLGIVKGVDATHFSPDTPLTYSQAVKMLVCTLGYEVVAEAQGGYPAGYLTEAAVLGVTDGTTTEMTRGTMAIMVLNTTEIAPFVQQAYGQAQSYAVQEDETLLHVYLGISKQLCRITATQHSTLTGSLAGKGNVATDDARVYAIGTSDAANLLGYKVTLYSKEIDGIETVLYAATDKRATKTVLRGADIDPKTTARRIYYTKDGNERQIAIDENATFVYNGVKTDRFSVPTISYLEILSDDGIAANTVFINEYADLIVDYANVLKKEIFFKNHEKITLTDDMSFIKADGTTVALDTLAQWDVITAIFGEKTTFLFLTNEKVSGEITELRDNYIAINGLEYPLAADLTVYPQPPYVGMKSTFSLNLCGEIAAISTLDEVSYKYGYLVSCGTTRGLAGVPQVVLYTQSDAMETLSFADTVTVMTNTMQTLSVKKDSILQCGLQDAGGNAVPMLLRYETNTAGEINKLSFAVDSAAAGLTSETRTNFFTWSYKAPVAKNIGRMFLTRYYLPDHCIVFSLPETPSTNPDDYKVLKPAELIHDTKYPNCCFYDVDENNAIGALTTTASIGETVGDTAICGLVTNVYTAVTEDGEEQICLSVVPQKGAETVLHGDSDTEVLFGTEDDTFENGIRDVITDITAESPNVIENGRLKAKIRLTDIRKGDVIAYEAVNGRLLAIAMRFRAHSPRVFEMGMTNGNGGWYPPRADDLWTTQILRYGTVLGISNEVIRTEAPGRTAQGVPIDGTVWERVEPLRGVKLLQYNLRTEQYTEITVAEIRKNDMFFSYRESIQGRMLIVYTN